LPQTGQAIEESGLASVGRADQDNRLRSAPSGAGWVGGSKGGGVQQPLIGRPQSVRQVRRAPG
jgi:hypothetical protein